MPFICNTCIDTFVPKRFAKFLYVYAYVYVSRIGAIDVLLFGNCGAKRVIIPSPNVEDFEQTESSLGKTHKFAPIQPLGLGVRSLITNLYLMCACGNDR